MEGTTGMGGRVGHGIKDEHIKQKWKGLRNGHIYLFKSASQQPAGWKKIKRGPGGRQTEIHKNELYGLGVLRGVPVKGWLLRVGGPKCIGGAGHSRSIWDESGWPRK